MPYWVPASNGVIPNGAVIGCKESNYVAIVARAKHEGHLLPGKFLPYFNYCCVCNDGKEIKITNYEVLCNTKVEWVKMSRGHSLPSNALPGGHTQHGQTLYIGRTVHDGCTIMGKVDPDLMCCVPYYDREHKFDEYELLVFSRRYDWVPASNGVIPNGAVIGCKESNYVAIVARAKHEGHLLPGKFLPYFNYCCVCNDGKEIKITNYEVLCNTKVEWVKMSRGQSLPSNALPGGHTQQGQTLYIGRTVHNGCTIMGKVDPDLMCCVPYYDREHKFDEYELLVFKQDE